MKVISSIKPESFYQDNNFICINAYSLEKDVILHKR